MSIPPKSRFFELILPQATGEKVVSLLVKKENLSQSKRKAESSSTHRKKEVRRKGETSLKTRNLAEKGGGLHSRNVSVRRNEANTSDTWPARDSSPSKKRGISRKNKLRG